MTQDGHTGKTREATQESGARACSRGSSGQARIDAARGTNDHELRHTVTLACQHNCHAAWTALYKHFYSDIRKLMLKLTHEDGLCNEVFKRAYARRTAYDGNRSTFRQWLIGFAFNVAREEWRRRKAVTRIPTLLEPLRTDVSEHPEELALQRERERQDEDRRLWLHVAIDALAGKQAEALRLCELNGLSAAEAAALMGESPDYIQTLKSRARMGLRKLAGRKGG